MAVHPSTKISCLAKSLPIEKVPSGRYDFIEDMIMSVLLVSACFINLSMVLEFSQSSASTNIKYFPFAKAIPLFLADACPWFSCVRSVWCSISFKQSSAILMLLSVEPSFLNYQLSFLISQLSFHHYRLSFNHVPPCLCVSVFKLLF